MNTTKEITLYDSPEAVTPMQRTVYKSKNGNTFLSEQSARYDSCTHTSCDCGGNAKKGWTKCDSCRAVSDAKRYESYPFKEWDGEAPLCEYDGDKYFFDEDDIEQYLEDNELEPEDLKLVFCKPNKFGHLQPDRWEDCLAEDQEYPKELIEKIKEFNEFIDTLQPVSWSPDKIRTSYTR